MTIYCCGQYGFDIYDNDGWLYSCLQGLVNFKRVGKMKEYTGSGYPWRKPPKGVCIKIREKINMIKAIDESNRIKIDL
ncbi:MAG: hypothetical protein EXR21_09220 [Flavobacteriaceae bacterium]|nr:hypothetical protein [Flavobacteriaceae bacterium]